MRFLIIVPPPLIVCTPWTNFPSAVSRRPENHISTLLYADNTKQNIAIMKLFVFFQSKVDTLASKTFETSPIKIVWIITIGNDDHSIAQLIWTSKKHKTLYHFRSSQNHSPPLAADPFILSRFRLFFSDICWRRIISREPPVDMLLMIAISIHMWSLTSPSRVMSMIPAPRWC